MSDIARSLLRIWEDHLAPLWQEFWEPVSFWNKYRPITSPTSGLDTVAICFPPLFIPAVFFWFFVGNLCCPQQVSNRTESLPNAAQVIINGIFGVPFYVLGMAFLNIWYLMLVVWFLLSLPLKALGLVQRGTFSHKREPQINTQVDLEE